jgi:amidase
MRSRAGLQGSTMFQKPTVADLREAAERLGMRPSEAYLDAVAEIITPLANAYATLDATPDELPAVKYPQREFYRPPAAEKPYGAWYVKTAIKGKAGGKLAGRRGGHGDGRRSGRLDPHPGEPLRHRRVEADLRACSLYRHRAAKQGRVRYFCVPAAAIPADRFGAHAQAQLSAGGSSRRAARLVAAGESGHGDGRSPARSASRRAIAIVG